MEEQAEQVEMELFNVAVVVVVDIEEVVEVAV
jgi:hypothetical protein